MPILKLDGDLHYFAHVPKCAGRSVEKYIKERFGHIWFVDDEFHTPPTNERWSLSSPQHITTSDLFRLFGRDAFASSFAVVRHPVTRVLSSFNYHKFNLGRIPLGMSFEEWLDEYERLKPLHPYHLDNHLRPQHELIPENATIFHLEDGLNDLVEYFDQLAGDKKGPRKIEKMHVSSKSEGLREVELPRNIARRLRVLYAEDFERYGYDPEMAETPMLYRFDLNKVTARERVRQKWRLTKRRVWRMRMLRTGPG